MSQPDRKITQFTIDMKIAGKPDLPPIETEEETKILRYLLNIYPEYRSLRNIEGIKSISAEKVKDNLLSLHGKGYTMKTWSNKADAFVYRVNSYVHVTMYKKV